MPFLLTRVPLVAAERIVAPAGTLVTLRAYQPVVWVRLAPWSGEPHPEAVTFPAVLDTGNNHTFLIPAPLFRAWARVEPNDLRPLRMVEVNGVLVPGHGFNLDLLRLRRGNPTDRVAARLQTDRGIAIIPDEFVGRFPRMPVLGVRSLTVNRVTFTLNGGRRTFSLFQQGRLTPARRGSA